MAFRGVRKTDSVSTFPDEPKPVLLWVLRILVHHGGFQAATGSNGQTLFGLGYITDPKVHAFLGLTGDHDSGESSDEIEDFFDKAKLREILKALHRRLTRLEKSRQQPGPSPALVANIAQLASLVNLNETESSLLLFAVMLSTSAVLRETVELLGPLGNERACAVLSGVLKLGYKDAVAALSRRGALAQSGLLRMEASRNFSLGEKLGLLSDAFAERMVTEEAAPLELLRDTITPSATPTLSRVDFAHVEQDLGPLLLYLRCGLDEVMAGINILIYGPSGTGKTELARLLGADLGVDLFEVASENEDGDAIDGGARMRAYRAAQVLLAKSSAILLFDEAEDIFGRGGDGLLALLGGKDGQAQSRKAWINKALESNATPTLWLTNSIAGIDPAFMRRFDMVIEMPIPPKRQRERIVTQSAAGMLPATTLSRLAQCEHLAPAVVARAVSVIRNIREHLPEAHIAGAVERLVDNTLRAQGHPALERMTALPLIYDPALVNAGANLLELSTGLIRANRGRLCLYGPSGTGKTAYARWLAEQLGRPLLVRRASDLIDKWLGASERNIASAFREAQSEGAVLLLDEVDSLLQERRGAQHAWEITQVNEMLTQMEAFEGVFIATTNLVNDLDQAALRRFDLKLKFDYLKADQGWDLFQRQCTALNLEAPLSLRGALARIDRLTPGDFAAVARRHDFSPLRDAHALLEALREECALKEGKTHAMGFVGNETIQKGD